MRLLRRFMHPGLGPHRFAIIFSTALFLVAVAGIVTAILVRERRATLEHAQQATAATALALEQHVAWTFRAVDMALGGVADTLRITPNIPKNHAPFQDALERRVQELRPYVRAIFVIGPDGWIIHDSEYPSTPNLSLADRPYFGLHQENPRLVRSIAPPLQSRSGTGWFIAVSRRVGFDDGFKGIAVAALQPEQFEVLYRRMGLGPGHTVSVYHRDGVLIARYPPDSTAVGKSFADFPLFSSHVPGAQTGSFIAKGGIFPYERVVSYRMLENGPLVVAVTHDTRYVLEGWRQTALWAAAAMIGLTLLLLAMIAQFIRRQRERDRAQRRLAHAEKLEALGLLTGGIAHDFANLLNVIAASLAIVARNPGKQHTDYAIAAADRALTGGKGLIARLLSFAKRQPLEVRPADLNTLVSGLVPLLRQAAGGDIDLGVSLDPDLPPCRTDESAFEVALLNLVVNAKDAMNGRGRVLLRSYKCANSGDPATDGGWVCLAVEDNGPGMSEEVRRRAIEPFFSTKGDTGTGLGLSQVYGFMRQIAGDVRIDSAPGRGTVVRLIFPAADSPAPESEPKAQIPVSSSSA